MCYDCKEDVKRLRKVGYLILTAGGMSRKQVASALGVGMASVDSYASELHKEVKPTVAELAVFAATVPQERWAL